MTEPAWAGARAGSLRRLHGLVSTINRDLDLDTTLRAVAQGVIDGLGFRVAVVNLVADGGDLAVVAVAGPEAAREALLGTSGSRAGWDAYLAGCEPVGALLVDYSGEAADVTDVPVWIPDFEVLSDDRAWQPLDELLAPLTTPRSGLLGVISVDLPLDGLRPGPEQLELLEMYAAQASLAVENARLHTRLVAQQAEREEALGRLSALVAEAPVAILELDLEGRVRLWNPGAELVFGWTREEVLGRPNPTVDGTDYAASLVRLASEGGVSRVEVRRLRKDGTEVDVEMSSAVLRGDDGRPFGFIGVLADITDRVRLQEELRLAALTDPLTGLANRTHFADALQEAADQGDTPVVLLLDLDGFKAVNDTLGHGAGDAVLREVADRLRRTCRHGELVARLGGDEFVVLIPDDDLAAGARLGDRLVEVLSDPFDIGGRPTRLGASVGVAGSHPGAVPDDLLRDADIAMYSAKFGGKGRLVVFEPQLHEAVVRRTDLVEALRTARGLGQLALRHHPVIEVSTGRVVALEALLRWHHPERGELAPAAFMDLAEETGLIVGIGEWVLHEACTTMRRWHVDLRHRARTSASVNVSAVQLRDGLIVPQVRDALAVSGLDPRRLVLELTETVMVDDPESAAEVLGELAGLGVRLALDDFGTGWSSLSQLIRLPVETVKLDRSLVPDPGADPGALDLLDGVLTLLRRLGKQVVAEGVETMEQLEVLRSWDCPFVQGMLFGPPLDPTAARALVVAGRVDCPLPQPAGLGGWALR